MMNKLIPGLLKNDPADRSVRQKYRMFTSTVTATWVLSSHIANLLKVGHQARRIRQRKR